MVRLLRPLVLLLPLVLACTQDPAGGRLPAAPGGSGGDDGTGGTGGAGGTGGTGGGGGVDPLPCEETPLPREQRCDAYAAAAVSALERCEPLPAEEVPAYRKYFRLSCESTDFLPPWYEPLIAEGGVIYDAVEASCRMERLARLDCGATVEDASRVWQEAQDIPVRGARALGASCEYQAECADGFCPSRECGRTCTPFLAAGEACDWGHLCAPDLACSPEEPRTCAPRLGRGEVCTSSQCAEPLFCTYQDGWTESHCAGFVFAGEACGPYAFCAGLCEDVDPATGLGTCAPYRAQGEACSGPGECDGGLRCEAGVCVLAGGLGAPCTGESWDECVDPFVCDPASWTCGPYLDVGEPCAGEWDRSACFWGFYCSEETGRCVDISTNHWPRAGDACSDDEDCGEAAICDGVRCVEGCR